MAYRKRIPRKKSRKIFKRASGTHRKNLRTSGGVRRGGIRL